MADHELHRNVRAVMAAAQGRGLAIAPRSFPDGTKTAADAAAGTWTDVFPVGPGELVRIIGGTVCPLSV